MDTEMELDVSRAIKDLSKKMEQMMDIAIRDKNYDAFSKLTAMYLLVLHFDDDESSAVAYLSDILGGNNDERMD